MLRLGTYEICNAKKSAAHIEVFKFSSGLSARGSHGSDKLSEYEITELAEPVKHTKAPQHKIAGLAEFVEPTILQENQIAELAGLAEPKNLQKIESRNLHNLRNL